MLYDELANLIESHKTELGQQMLQFAASGSNMDTYREVSATAPVDEQGQTFISIFQHIANYIRSGDPTEWRNNIALISADSLDKGYPKEALVAIGLKMIELMKGLVDRTYPGDQHVKTRRLYYSQLDNTNILARTTLISTQAKKR